MLIDDILEDCMSRIDWTQYPYQFLNTMICQFSGAIITVVIIDVTDDKVAKCILSLCASFSYC
jgi:hypothetical protein